MAGDRPSNGTLFDIYRTYIGEPDSDRDVYVGFGLFICGTAVAAVALGLFIWSSGFDRSNPAYFAWTEPAYALGMLSLPTMMLGIVVLLPAERKVLATSVAGAGIIVAATVGFVYAYPSNWNFLGEADYTVEITATYAVGLAAITASTGGALIAHYLDMARRVEAVDVEADDAEEVHYSDEEIERDIDDAMEDVELSWGGVSKTENTRLQFSDHEFDDANFEGGAGVKTARSSGVDDAVAGLKGLKGGEAKTETSSETVDDQTQKLKELREQQRREREADAADTGVFGGVKAKLSSLVRTDR